MKRRCLVALALAVLWSCGDHSEKPPAVNQSPTARLDIVDALRADVESDRHPADGGGRAWLELREGQKVGAKVGEPGRFDLVYEAGPHGVAEGGVVFLQVSPFWGWSTPQVGRPMRPGYTEVSTRAEGVELVASTLDQQLLGIEVRGRALAQGERIEIAYGAGEAAAAVDEYAERRSRFWIGVDGDGDGVRGLVEESPAVDVGPGAPARLLLWLPATARPGETVMLTVAVVDRVGNAGVELADEVVFGPVPDGLEAPDRVGLTVADRGRLSVPVRVTEHGVWRLRAHTTGGLEAESPPLVVERDGPPILWADLHGHSGFSDGTGLPEDYYRYAREVAGLDVAALTDHDHWGIPFLDASPAMWEEIEAAADRVHESGRFVALVGYEWTSWIWGHRHVLFFGDGAEIRSSLDPRFDEPHELWHALRGLPALTVAHHSAGGPIATDWTTAPDPELEPVTEVVSVHGSSEAPDSPRTIYSPVAGNFVRDALARGFRLGFVGSGDGHDGHPGLAHLGATSGGLAAILAENRTREAVLEALRERRCYATNGARIVLRATLGGREMGSLLAPGTHRLVVRAATERPLDRVDIVRGAEVVAQIDAHAEREIEFERDLDALISGEFVYVRVVQDDGGAAWSSPFFVE